MPTSRVAVVLSMALSGCGGDAPRPSTPPAAPPAASVDAARTSASEAPAPTPPPSAPAAAAVLEPPVELVLAEARPQPATSPTLAILSPRAEQVIPSARLAATTVKLGARGAARVCLSLDARPCVDVDPSRPPALSELGPLDEGQHLLVLVARDESGEVLRLGKKKPAFAVVSFHVERRAKPAWRPGDPILVPVLPPPGAAGGERTLDFLLANAEAAAGKHLVQVSIAGPGITRAETSDDGRPYKLRGARRGTYTVRMALARYSPELGESGSSTTVHYKSRTMVGPYVDSTRTFRVE